MQKQTWSSETSRGEGLDRRQVLLGSFGALGVLPRCCTTPEIAEGSYRFEGGNLLVDLEKAAGLRGSGSSVAIVDMARKLDLMVVRVEKNRFVALDRSCTHNNGQCAYNPRRRTLQCTSLNHAEYDLQGTLLHGRTHGNLRSYEVRMAGSVLEIRLEG